MLKLYGEKAEVESAACADELAAADDHKGAVVWAPDHRCSRAAREQDTSRPGALTGRGGAPKS